MLIWVFMQNFSHGNATHKLPKQLCLSKVFGGKVKLKAERALKKINYLVHHHLALLKQQPLPPPPPPHQSETDKPLCQKLYKTRGTLLCVVTESCPTTQMYFFSSRTSLLM